MIPLSFISSYLHFSPFYYLRSLYSIIVADVVFFLYFCSMKIIVAVDSFKGCLTSAQAGQAVEEAVRCCCPEADVVTCVVSDGGDGMLEAFCRAYGAKLHTVSVHDPLMRPIQARYGITAHGMAIIESAQACGLTLMSADERNPLRATTYGVGEMVADAVRQGCRSFIVGLGGSGTSDAGMGMLRALVDAFAPAGGHIDDVLSGQMADCSFTLACDVDNPLCGPQGAAEVYAPQKGASREDVRTLDRRAAQFARMSAAHFGFDCSDYPGAGAAGGLGYAFMQYFQARRCSGADMLLDALDMRGIMQGADVVITGEGSADRQTLMGKMPSRVLSCAADCRVPVWLLAGRLRDTSLLREAGFARLSQVTPEGCDLAEAMQAEVAVANIQRVVKDWLDSVKFV